MLFYLVNQLNIIIYLLIIYLKLSFIIKFEHLNTFFKLLILSEVFEFESRLMKNLSFKSELEITKL